jgi:hypothetical protein
VFSFQFSVFNVQLGAGKALNRKRCGEGQRSFIVGRETEN